MLSDSLHYELTFGLSVMNMDKAERLRFGESMMTHAMSITGMHIEVLPSFALLIKIIPFCLCVAFACRVSSLQPLYLMSFKLLSLCLHNCVRHFVCDWMSGCHLGALLCGDSVPPASQCVQPSQS